MSGAFISYKRYQFNSPKIIDEQQFRNLKNDWLRNPESIFKPQIESWKEKLTEVIIAAGICLLGGASTSCLASWLGHGIWGDILEVIALGFGLGIFTTLISLFSYWGFRSDFHHYYDKLKEHVIKADTYEQFVKEFGDGFAPELNEVNS